MLPERVFAPAASGRPTSDGAAVSCAAWNAPENCPSEDCCNKRCWGEPPRRAAFAWKGAAPGGGASDCTGIFTAVAMAIGPFIQRWFSILLAILPGRKISENLCRTLRAGSPLPGFRPSGVPEKVVPRRLRFCAPPRCALWSAVFRAFAALFAVPDIPPVCRRLPSQARAVRGVPTRQAIEESIDLAHEVYNQVFRKVPEKVKEMH